MIICSKLVEAPFQLLLILYLTKKLLVTISLLIMIHVSSYSWLISKNPCKYQSLDS